MALPAHVLERLPSALLRSSLLTAEAAVLPLGIPQLDALLPGGGFLRGGVVELSQRGGAAWGLPLALLAVRAAQQAPRALGAAVPWCALVDAGGTLHAPALVERGVEASRLLVVRPFQPGGGAEPVGVVHAAGGGSSGVLARVALRLVESQAFSVVVVDLAGVPGAPLAIPLAGWERTVRRLAQAVAGSGSTVVLLTSAEARRPLPLPVAQRLELSSPGPGVWGLRVVKDRHGRIGAEQLLRWSAAGLEGAAPGAVGAPANDAGFPSRSAP